jgi:beta-alanine--pyruvate transaminase
MSLACYKKNIMSSENRPSVPNSLNEHWMPFTANKDFKANPRLITEAKGMYLKNHHGKTMIDASSGLFCNPFGHGRKEIIEAVTKQLETLDYTQPFQQGFGGSFELATRITKHTPGNLNRIFFSTGGSDAVETAIKISIAYHKANGQGERFRIVGRERAYHGMHIGGTSVGGMINNVKTYASLLMPGVVHMRHTHLPEHKFVSGQPETGAELANDLERFAANFGAENIAACIVEPTAGSTGTLVPPKGYLQRLREICDKHGILLIFDEVITGWGRMGSAFASQEFGVTPDIMTIAKATTNGVVPMGAVACKEEIYNTIVDNAPKGAIELFHGYTYSAIPVAVAAGLAVQDIIEKEDIFNRVKELVPYYQKAIFSLKDLDAVDNIRGYGLMAGIDMKLDQKPGKAGFTCYKHCYDIGINFKATGDCLIIAPMFISEKKHIDEIVEKLRTGISNYSKNKKN